MHLFFGNHHDTERLLELIEEHRESLQKKLGSLRQTGQRIEGMAKARFGMMCLRHGLQSYEGTLAWLDEVEEEIRAMAREKEEQDGYCG